MRPPVLSMRRWRRVALVCVTSLALPSWGLDLMQAYRLALAQDATLRAAQAAAASVTERRPQALAQLLPNASWGFGRNQNDLRSRRQGSVRFPDDEYFSYNQTLQIRQPLFRKPLWDGLAQSDHLVADAQATLERESQNLGVRVTGAYLEALLAQDQLELVLKQQALVQLQLDAAVKALVAGSGIRTDIDEAQARLDMARAQEFEARQNLDYTQRQLAVLTQQPPEPLAPLDPSRLVLGLPDPSTPEAWLALAETHSPEIQALQARAEAARLEVAKAEGGHLPTLDAVWQLTRSGSENVTAPSSSYANRSLGLQLNIPLYAGGYTSSVVRQAVAEYQRAQETLEAARRDLGLRLHREFRGVSEGVLKIQALQQAEVSGEQLVRSMRRAFAAGSRTSMDVLNAEQQLQTARRDLAQARYLYLIARVRLQALAGLDKEAVLADINACLHTPAPAS